VPHSPELVEGSRRVGLSYPRQRVLQKHETTLRSVAFSPGRNNSLESTFFQSVESSRASLNLKGLFPLVYSSLVESFELSEK